MDDSDTKFSRAQCGLQEAAPGGLQIKRNEQSLDSGSPCVLLILNDLSSESHQLSMPQQFGSEISASLIFTFFKREN